MFSSRLARWVCLAVLLGCTTALAVEAEPAAAPEATMGDEAVAPSDGLVEGNFIKFIAFQKDSDVRDGLRLLDTAYGPGSIPGARMVYGPNPNALGNRLYLPVAGSRFLRLEPVWFANSEKAGLLGGGSWGTTVGSLVARNAPTPLWARSQATADEINRHRDSILAQCIQVRVL